KPLGSVGFVLELIAAAIGYGSNIQKECVVRSSRLRIFDRDRAVDSVPFTLELDIQSLGDQNLSGLADSNRVVKIGNAPALRIKRYNESRKADEQQHATASRNRSS